MRTIKDLRKAIENLPDDMPLFTPGHDHSYSSVYGLGVEWVEVWHGRHYSQVPFVEEEGCHSIFDEYYSGFNEDDRPIDFVQGFIIE